MSPPAPPQSLWLDLLTQRRVGPIGAVGGLMGGLLDVVLVRVLGVEATLDGRDATALLILVFAGSYALLGLIIGRLLETRHAVAMQAGIIADREATIHAQMAALERTQRAALESERLATIGQLAAGVAHEVRNPLGVIRAGATLLQEDAPPGSEAWRAAELIREEVDRLNRFVTAMLGVARPVGEARRPVDVGEAAARAVALSRDALGAQGVTIIAEIDAPPVRGDGDLLAQLLLCLITNAAQALPDGGVVRLRSEATPDRVLVEVADDGPGIPAADLERVFEPFYTTRPQGTGLGLVMARRLAHWHGGALIALPPGHGAGPGGAGACLRIELPRAPVEAGPEAALGGAP